MSIKVIHWALNQAPVDEPVQVLILVAMAERANDDGTATYQSVATIADKARISVRTCQRHMQALEDAGLITRGDQEHVAHYPANRRPVVYDLSVRVIRGAKLAPQGSGVPNSTPRGAKSETRGANQGTLGVPLVADNSSSDSSLLNRPKNRPARSARTLPDDFVITVEMVKWARDKVPGVDGRYETEKFKNWHLARGSKFKDWEAAWRNWMLKASEMELASGRSQRVPDTLTPDEWMSRYAGQPGTKPKSKLGIDYDNLETE